MPKTLNIIRLDYYLTSIAFDMNSVEYITLELNQSFYTKPENKIKTMTIGFLDQQGTKKTITSFEDDIDSKVLTQSYLDLVTKWKNFHSAIQEQEQEFMDNMS